MTSNPSPLTLAENFIKATIAEPHYAGFDVEICSNLTVISASDTPRPTATSRIKVTQSLCNPTNHLHGGAQATLFDNCTTLALATVRKEGYWEMAGVTRNLDVTCLLPVAMGEEICIETEVISIGKRYALILGTMVRVRDGAVVAVCKHDKVNLDRPAVPSRGKPKV